MTDKSFRLSSLPRLHKGVLDAYLQAQQCSISDGIRLQSLLHALPFKLSAGLEDQRKTPPLPSSILLSKKYFYCIKMYACVHIYMYRNKEFSRVWESHILPPESRAAIPGAGGFTLFSAGWKISPPPANLVQSRNHS